MSKRYSHPWHEDDGLDFSTGTHSAAIPKVPLNGEDDTGTVFLEEAHEALSKLVNKTQKRNKPAKASHRKDAWQ